ncbi:hypothetical protein Q8W71_31850 [Methylobacterium sp. NEAU 140]|uniref:hypothetical protein n=1 Tax=Methylobacterium sp. NEAU 140 TaxID=3064945 RepID=UPI00273444D6|nr:hypothetical protein [Methylobacterium sp. NEAU 140]MDP4027174.1 hypothetical protein [Methylobacterium sp. NEAU 140]
MSESISTTLAFVVLIIVAAAVALFVNKRQREAHARREAEMREAVDLLAVHAKTLAILDDDAMPASLAAFALEVSDLLHDFDQRPVVLAATRIKREEYLRSPRLSTGLGPETERLQANLETLLATRPDLATAYVQSIVAGILSFERRFPECAGAFGLDVAKLIASPVNEAERVVRQAKTMRAGWTPEPAMAA